MDYWQLTANRQEDVMLVNSFSLRPFIGRRGLLLLLLLLLGALPAVALAQTSLAGDTAAEPPTTQENARVLAQILEDEKSRDALIRQLLSIAESESSGVESAPAEPPAASSLARVFAEYSVEVAESFTTTLEAIRDWVLRTYDALSAEDGRTLRSLGDVGVALLLVIVPTIAVFLGLSVLLRTALRWMGSRAEQGGWLRRGIYLLAATCADAVVVLVAWASGYLLALFTHGELGRMDINGSLYLNAFLFVELLRVLLRAILAPRDSRLRPLPMSDTTAAYWYFWTGRLTAFLGYGLLLVVPIVGASFPNGVAEGVAILIAFTTLVVAVVLVLQNRQNVATILKPTSRGSGELVATARAALARSWHIIVIGYLIGLFAIWSTRPVGALSLVLRATGESILMIALGAILMTVLSRFVTGGMRLPDDVKSRLPLLESRLNAFVPTVLKVVQPVILMVVILLVAQAWGLFDLFGWFGSDIGRSVVARALGVLLITVGAFLLWLAISSWVEYRLNPNVGSAPSPRERTLLSLLRNAATITIVAVAIMIVLSEIGVNIGPLLAGAGVLGLAIGFGAQKLVQDIITGVFIQFENAINEGDVVTVAGITGAVDRLTIRSVSLRDLHGTYHIVPFSSVDSVSNFMRGFSYHVAEIGFAYREDLSETKALMQRAFDELQSQEAYGPHILDPLEWHGVTQLGDSAVVQRARIKTVPGQQWAVGRAYTEIVKRLCDEAGVEIPFPHTTVYFGEDKSGTAPPAHVQFAQNPNAHTTGSGSDLDSSATAR